jgi:hypothetical protein
MTTVKGKIPLREEEYGVIPLDELKKLAKNMRGTPIIIHTDEGTETVGVILSAELDEDEKVIVYTAEANIDEAQPVNSDKT